MDRKTSFCWLRSLFAVIFCMTSTIGLMAQGGTHKVSGTITSQGEPLIGALVAEKGTVNGVLTDLDGTFIINVNLYKNIVKIGQHATFTYVKNRGIDTGSQYNNSLRGALNTSPLLPMYDDNGQFVNTGITDQREYTGYSNKKYAPRAVYNSDGKLVDEAENLGAVNFMIGQFQDYVSIRFADVLLMAAELGSANAQNYFDKVRQRAYGDKFVSKAVSKENILEERRLEFAFEGIRYWDVLRQGVSYAANVFAESITVKNGGIVTQKTIDGGNFTKTKGFQQIPNTQISLSKNVLKQNSGW